MIMVVVLCLKVSVAIGEGAKLVIEEE